MLTRKPIKAKSFKSNSFLVHRQSIKFQRKFWHQDFWRKKAL